MVACKAFLVLGLSLLCCAAIAAPTTQRRRKPNPPPSPPTPPPTPSPSLPFYAGPVLNASQPLGGLKKIPGAINSCVLKANPDVGTYNHAAMLDYHDGLFLLAWKNGAIGEDDSNQRILFATSQDGLHWSTVTNSTSVLFPGMSTDNRLAALFVGPPIIVNGRRYVGASVGKAPAGAAQGAQFCLWPDALNPRNTVVPTKKNQEHPDDLLMREVHSDGSLGEIFWQHEIPAEWTEASKLHGFNRVSDMDVQTQSDMSTLSATASTEVFCSQNGTLKCEACPGGCQLYSSIPPETSPYIGNERTHYTMPGNHSVDVILYRSGEHPALYASIRTAPGQGSWQPPVLTNIPNDESNINAGSLPDGRIYLLNNAVFQSKDSVVETLRFRDPLTVSTSKDGLAFDSTASVMSCTSLAPWSTCAPRYDGDGKNPGPSYPQGVTVVDPAPRDIQGMYVVATNNKEDVWVTKLPFNQF